MKKECVTCQNLFYVKPSHYDKRRACSRECIWEYYKKSLRGRNNPNFKGTINKICLICNSTYKSYSKKRKMCSLKCVGIYNRKDIIKKEKIKKTKKEWKCIDCKKKVERKIVRCLKCREAKFYKNNRLIKCRYCLKEFRSYLLSKKTMCSSECSNAWKSSFYRSNKNPNYKDGRKPLTKMIRDSDKFKNIKKKILIRDNYTCKVCHKYGQNLNIDHIIKFSIIYEEFIKNFSDKVKNDKDLVFKKALNYYKFWDLNNLQVLCRKCNWQKEILYRREQRQLNL